MSIEACLEARAARGKSLIEYDRVVFRFSGEPDELFLPAALTAASIALAGEWPMEVVMLDYRRSDFPEMFTVHVDGKATFAQVLAIYGEELAADPPTVSLASAARGGDGPAYESVLATIDKTIQIGGYVGAALTVWKVAAGARYRKWRALAKDWNDSGVISMELRQVVLSSPQWARWTFDRAFKLSAERGPLLLRELGYEKNSDPVWEVWTERAWAAEMNSHRP